MKARYTQLKRKARLVVNAYSPLSNETMRSLARAQLTLESYARKNPRAFYVQVGAHNGKGLDPIHFARGTKNWSGILIEPVPAYFDELKKNKSGQPNLILENVAISDSDSRTIFYAVDPSITERYPHWASMLSSFRRDVVLRSKAEIPDIEDYIREIEVESIRFESLMARHNIQKLDVVLIDTEGYDFEILKQLDLQKLQPDIVIFENKHLGPDTAILAQDFLRSNGYKIKFVGEDCIAQRRG